MNMTSALRDAWYFFSHNLLAIARLCLPLIVLEGLLLQQVTSLVDAESATLWRLLAGLLFYPLYSAALILFLDARSQGQQPRARDLLAASLRLWPSFALLAGLNTLAILLGASLFVLPGIWLMVKLAFAEYLLVLRGLSPMKALHESFQLSSGYFWPYARVHPDCHAAVVAARRLEPLQRNLRRQRPGQPAARLRKSLFTTILKRRAVSSIYAAQRPARSRVNASDTQGGQSHG